MSTDLSIAANWDNPCTSAENIIVMSCNTDEDKFDPLSFRIPGQFTYKDDVHSARQTSPGHLEKVATFQFHPDDVIIASYQKTGTTITLELVYLIRNGGDVEKTKENILSERVPFIDNDWGKENRLDCVHALPHPRTVSTHCHFEMMENAVVNQKIRVVYVMRNPKDTLVSLFYYYKMNEILGCFPGTWDQFFEMAMANFDGLARGNMLDHFVGWWNQRHLPNILILKFEDLIRNRKREILRIAQFCGETSLSDETIEAVIKATDFSTMKNSEQTNREWSWFLNHNISHFYRKGEIGDWKNHFTVAQNERFDKMIDSKLAGTGLDFCYE